jgi:hypothetical protein
MEPTSMMRVNAHPGSYGERGSTPQDRQQQRRQKLLALFDAVVHGNLDTAKLTLKMLMNIDPALGADLQFVRLSKALAVGNLYVAQHIVHELKTKFINATPLADRPAHAAGLPAHTHRPDGLHFVDTCA